MNISIWRVTKAHTRRVRRLWHGRDIFIQRIVVREDKGIVISKEYFHLKGNNDCDWEIRGLWYKEEYSYLKGHHHHHHIVLAARISLTLSRHSSLSFIALGRSSGQQPVSSHSCWMYVRAGRPAFARPCVGIHKSTSLMSSSLLLQQCPACLVRLTWIVFVIGGRWPYSWCLVGCCCQDLFRIARSIVTLKEYFWRVIMTRKRKVRGIGYQKKIFIQMVTMTQIKRVRGLWHQMYVYSFYLKGHND